MIACAVLAAGALGAIGVLHTYWALGGRWPGHDEASLARHVLSASGPAMMPPAALTAVLGIALMALAWVPLALNGVAPILPEWVLRAALYLAIGVFTLRGVVGLFEQRIKPGDPTAPYVRLNRVFHSPLCLLIALLLLGSTPQ